MNRKADKSAIQTHLKHEIFNENIFDNHHKKIAAAINANCICCVLCIYRMHTFYRKAYFYFYDFKEIGMQKK